jgi:hypothetical protein
MSTIWANVRTIGLVTLVTVLIWVWADAETQKDDLLRPSDGHAGALDEIELTVDTLPVMIALPAKGGPPLWQRVKPDASELKHVTIAGPRAVVDRLNDKDGGLRLTAVLALDDEDWKASIVSKSVELSPGGLGLHFVGPVPTVRVSIGQ